MPTFKQRTSAGDEAWKRLLLQYQMRQKAAEELQAREEADRAKAQAEADYAAPGSRALQGAALGSAAGPWGTLVGGVAGHLYGAYEAGSKGKGGFDWGEAGSALSPTRTLAALGQPGGMQNASTAIGTVGAEMGRRDTAASQKAGLSAAQQQMLGSPTAPDSYMKDGSVRHKAKFKFKTRPSADDAYQDELAQMVAR